MSVLGSSGTTTYRSCILCHCCCCCCCCRSTQGHHIQLLSITLAKPGKTLGQLHPRMPTCKCHSRCCPSWRDSAERAGPNNCFRIHFHFRSHEPFRFYQWRPSPFISGDPLIDIFLCIQKVDVLYPNVCCCW